MREPEVTTWFWSFRGTSKPLLCRSVSLGVGLRGESLTEVASHFRATDLLTSSSYRA